MISGWSGGPAGPRCDLYDWDLFKCMCTISSLHCNQITSTLKCVKIWEQIWIPLSCGVAWRIASVLWLYPEELQTRSTSFSVNNISCITCTIQIRWKKNVIKRPQDFSVVRLVTTNPSNRLCTIKWGQLSFSLPTAFSHCMYCLMGTDSRAHLNLCCSLMCHESFPFFFCFSEIHSEKSCW